MVNPEKPDPNYDVPDLGPLLPEFVSPRILDVISRRSRAVGVGVAALIFAGIGVLEVGARADNEFLKDVGVVVYDIDTLESCGDISEETMEEISDLVDEHTLIREQEVFDRWFFDEALVAASENGLTLEDPSFELLSLDESDSSIEMIGIAKSYFAKLGIEYGYTTKDSDDNEHDFNYDADDIRKHLSEVIRGVSILPIEFIKYSKVSKITSQPHDTEYLAGTYGADGNGITLSIEPVHRGLMRYVAFHEFAHAFDSQYCGKNTDQDLDWYPLIDKGYVSEYSRSDGTHSEDKAEVIGYSNVIMNLDEEEASKSLEEKLVLMSARIESVVPGAGKYLVEMSD